MDMAKAEVKFEPRGSGNYQAMIKSFDKSARENL
jgi:hypothetical protein